MEPVGLGIGIAGLAGTLSACIDCFEYIQLGRQFGQDYGKCLLKLDTVKLRISRWGAAMGLGSEPKLKPQLSVSSEEIRLAQSLLEQILESFKDAERISERFKKHTSIQDANSNELLVYNLASDMGSDYQRLHLTVRELAYKRQKGTSIGKKAAWVLYEKRRFEGMIEEVNGFTSQLVDLFPAAQDDQRAQCKAEVSTINKSQDLTLLNNVACQDDHMLSAEIIRELDNRGHNVTDWKADGNSKVWAGDENAFGVNSKGHNFARFTVSGHADVHLGNINRGK
ncbi:MAG: hypothetical protein Q9167_000240 [Letrouitia subvulpina]